MYFYYYEDIYIYALSLVKELGGTKYSVGSDGPYVRTFSLEFRPHQANPNGICHRRRRAVIKNKARILFPSLIRLFLKNYHSKYSYSLIIKSFSNSKISQDS